MSKKNRSYIPLLRFLVLLIVFNSCTLTKYPEYKGVSDIRIIKANKTEFVVEMRLIYHNPNDVGGTLQAKDIKVFIDSVQVANANSEIFHIPKQKEFTVPLTTSIPFKKVYENNKGGLLGSVLDVISNKKVSLSYKGDIRYSLGSFHYDYPLDYTQELSLK